MKRTPESESIEKKLFQKNHVLKNTQRNLLVEMHNYY